MKDAVPQPGSRICCLLFTRGSLIPILPTPPRIPGGEVKRSESPQPPQAGCDLLASASPQASGRRVFPSSPRPSSLQKLLAIHGALLNTLSPTVPAHNLALHERLPEILIVPREETHTAAAARGNT